MIINMAIYEHNICTENKAEKGKSNQAFVQVNTQTLETCPLCVLALGNFCGEKSAWPRHRLVIF